MREPSKNSKETYYIRELHIEEPPDFDRFRLSESDFDDEDELPPVGYGPPSNVAALKADLEAMSRQPCLPAPTRAYRPAKKQVHWLFYFGVAAFVLVFAVWLTLTIKDGWTNWNNDRLYGHPRTFQTDQVVGHNDNREHPTHFVIVNLNHQAVVTEYPGGGAAKATYISQIGIVGPGSDDVPVTLSFQDENGDGKADMLVHVLFPEREQYQIFINTGTGFRLATNNDRIGGKQ